MLAVYIECTPAVANSEFVYGNPKDGDRVVRRALQLAMENVSFSKIKSGNMGTHSLRKGAATFGSRSGLNKDYVNRRGRWRTRKAMVDTYIDNTQPYPDACAAVVLAGPNGPCRYVLKHGLSLLTREIIVNEVAPTSNRVFGEAVAETLGCVLLWAALESKEIYSSALLPTALQERTIQAYVHAGGNREVNPIVREQFHVVGDDSVMYLITLSEIPIDSHANVNKAGASTTSTSQHDRRQFAALHSEIFSLKRYMTDILNEVQRARHDTQRDLDRFSAILHRHTMRPVATVSMRLSQDDEQCETTSTARKASAPVQLSKRPKDLFDLWHEYEFGCGGRKPAKNFTAAERGANKFAFSRQKVFWDTVAGLVRAGYTSDVAIDKVYNAYGRQLSTSSGPPLYDFDSSGQVVK
ncbi:hypothetical protein AC1031_016810 [Aphanomyces cochlioides]|nr:hypothetical protein AC1031_016810 [Aphanomyces cochlioides]